MDQLKEILNTFTPITLAEMDSVKLMDRTDTKFLFPVNSLHAILNEIKDQYRILEVNGNRISQYESLYFDTPDFDLFHQHRRGKLNRYKVRFRRYVESELNFFEIKFKNNKGRTIKDRVKQKQIDGTIQDKAEVLLKEKTTIVPNSIRSKILGKLFTHYICK
ncbi:MAG: VTC domain-containing protein [Bacteroidetes bacterium]|nr:VTC domain-containing protein [Bacteroidota bacterium]